MSRPVRSKAKVQAESREESSFVLVPDFPAFVIPSRPRPLFARPFSTPLKSLSQSNQISLKTVTPANAGIYAALPQPASG